MTKKYHNNNELTKQHELTIDISANRRRSVVTNTQFFTKDVGTGKKIINFTMDGVPFNLTDKKVVLGFEFVAEEASRIINGMDEEISIENARLGRISVNLPNHVYQYSGEVLIHAYIIYPDGRSLDAGIIVTEFEKSWLDNELPEMEKFYFRQFEDLEHEIRERAEALKEQIDGWKNNVQTDVDRIAGELADLDIPNHINNQAIHITNDEREVLFAQTIVYTIDCDSTIENTREKQQLIPSLIVGRTIASNGDFLSVGEDVDALRVETVGQNLFDGVVEMGTIIEGRFPNQSGAGGINGASWMIHDDGTLEIGEGFINWTAYNGPWHTHRDSIIHIVVTGPVTAGSSLRSLFRDLAHVREIEGLHYFDTTRTTNMENMFRTSTGLMRLDLSSFDTSRANNMSRMFTSTPELRELTLGPQFNFMDATLLAVRQTEDFTGLWQNVGAGTVTNPTGEFVFTSAQLVAQFDGVTMADTFVWQPVHRNISPTNVDLLEVDAILNINETSDHALGIIRQVGFTQVQGGRRIVVSNSHSSENHILQFDKNRNFLLATNTNVGNNANLTVDLLPETRFIRWRSGDNTPLDTLVSIAFDEAIAPEVPHQSASTTIEYQDVDGLWKKPILRSSLDGSIFDEINGNEFIQRLDHQLIPLTQMRKFPIRMQSLFSFEPVTHVQIITGTVQPKVTFKLVRGLDARLALAESAIRNLQRLVKGAM